MANRDPSKVSKAGCRCKKGQKESRNIFTYLPVFKVVRGQSHCFAPIKLAIERPHLEWASRTQEVSRLAHVSHRKERFHSGPFSLPQESGRLGIYF